MPLYKRADKDGYITVRQPSTGKEQRIHWVLARSGVLGKIPSFGMQQTVIHHKDFTPSNNTPENLEFMGDSDHSVYHRGLVERNLHLQSEEFEVARVRALQEKAETPEGHAYYAERGTKNILAYMKENPEHFKKSVKDNGKRGKVYLSEYNKSEKGREQSRINANKIHVCPHCGKSGRSGFFYATHINKCVDALRVAQANHKVVRVTVLEDREDVYCLTVPEYHNFALSSGVFVHNCGLLAVQYPAFTAKYKEGLPKETYRELYKSISRMVPLGVGKQHKEAQSIPFHKFKGVVNRWPHYALGLDIVGRSKFEEKTAIQLGSLGAGNHFIELQVDEDSNIWIMVHSGSRNPGNGLGFWYMKKAKELNEKWHTGVPRDLDFLPLDDEWGQSYVNDMDWSVEYSMHNRLYILQLVEIAIQNVLGIDMYHGDSVHIAHNYATMENHFGKNVLVHRKGATPAREGMRGVVPGSMGANSYITVGKGNPDSFMSCSHGAGRTMSRTKAKKTFTREDMVKALHDIGSYGFGATESLLDETPQAYKDIDVVMEKQQDLVEITHRLRPLFTVKGT